MERSTILPLLEPVDVDNLYEQLTEKKLTVQSSNITIPTSLEYVVITKSSLNHIFRMGKKKSRCENVNCKVLDGYHLPDNTIQDREKVYSFCITQVQPHVAEGHIISTTKHLPVYKTFFTGLKPEDIINRLKESLLNVTSIENQDLKWKLNGIGSGISITCIVEKNSFKLITFFPSSNRSRQERSACINADESLHRKYFFNPLFKTIPHSSPDFAQLAKHFGDGISVDLKYVHMDIRSLEFCVAQRLLFGVSKPQMESGFLPSNIVMDLSKEITFYRQIQTEMEAFFKCDEFLASEEHHQALIKEWFSFVWDLPTSEIEIKSSLEKFYLPVETIQKVFSKRSERFPDFLSDKDIINKLKEAVQNFCDLLQEDFKESIWEDEEEERFVFINIFNYN